MAHEFGGLVLGIAIGIVIAWLYFLVWKLRYSATIREDAVQRSLAVTAGKVHEQLDGRHGETALDGVLSNRRAIPKFPEDAVQRSLAVTAGKVHEQLVDLAGRHGETALD